MSVEHPPPPGPPGAPRHTHLDGTTCQWVRIAGIDDWACVDERNRNLGPCPGLSFAEEDGRRLASERDDLIADGADPADLVVPMSPTSIFDAARLIGATIEPTRMILHPRMWDQVDAHARVESAPTREMKMQIADAFEIPYWVLGIEGHKPPLRVRLRRARRRVTMLPDRLPGVAYYGPRRTGWYTEPRFGRWWAHVGPWRIATKPEPW